MRRFTRIAAMSLIVTMFVLMWLTGCGKAGDVGGKATSPTAQKTTASQTGTISEPLAEVTLKYYQVGGLSPGWQEVMAATNAKLKERINATIDVAEITWGDFDTKYPLICASGEPFDMIFCATWGFYAEEGNKGAFMPLNDLLPIYAPKIWNDCPPEVFEGNMLNGKICRIPCYLSNVSGFHGIYYREDLRKKYDVPEIKKLTDFEAFFEAVKKNEPEIVPLNWAASETAQLPFLYFRSEVRDVELTDYGTSSVDMRYLLGDPNPKLVSTYFDPGYDEAAALAKRWADKGFWGKNVLSNKTASKDNFMQGVSAAGLWNMWAFNDVYKAAKAEHPDWEVKFYVPFPKSGKASRNNFADGMAIGANSKNPERALMAIELLLYDEDINVTSNYGVEGVHYVKLPNGSFALPEGKKQEDSFSFGNIFEMALNNSAFKKTDTSMNAPDFNKMSDVDYYNSLTIYPALIDIVFDTESIKTEIAAIMDLRNTYQPVLMAGMADDPAAVLAEFREKLKQAGVDRVQAEAQRQVDAYLAAKK
jgi:putative aldouronate transport system substrate-binding protein